MHSIFLHCFACVTCKTGNNIAIFVLLVAAENKFHLNHKQLQYTQYEPCLIAAVHLADLACVCACFLALCAEKNVR